MQITNSSRSSIADNRWIPRWLLILIVGLAPVIVTGVLLLSFHLSLDRFLPRTWNDQVYYWHQIATFREAGFAGGYYAINEIPAPNPYFHFGAWGFVYPAVYGSVARLTGWQPTTPVILNAALLALSLWGFLFTSNFDRRQILFTLLVVLTITPVVFFIPTISQESFHQSVAILLAGLLVYLFRAERPLSLVALLLLAAGFSALIMIRLSWAYLLPPVLLLAYRRWSRFRVILVIGGSGLLIAALYIWFQATSGPAAQPLIKEPGEMVSRFIKQAVLLIPPKTFLAPYSDVLLTIQFMLILLATGYLAVKGVWRQPRIKEHFATAARWEMVFHGYNLGVLLVLALALYIPDGYYRVFAPHLLLSLLVLIGLRHFRLVSLVIFVGLIGSVLFYRDYGRFIPHNFDAPPVDETEALRTAFENVLVYDEAAPTPWCNTLLVPVGQLNFPVVFVPGGIGVSFYFTPDGLQYPLLSQYLLLDDQAYTDMGDRIHVERLVHTTAGDVYRNLDAECSPEGSS